MDNIEPIVKPNDEELKATADEGLSDKELKTITGGDDNRVPVYDGWG